MKVEHHMSENGFTLIEALVALMIMAIVGLMAWRGMDAMIRGREIIESRSKQDAAYVQLVRQFERDCYEMLSSAEFDLPPYSLGEKNISWIRHQHENNQNSWMIVSYGMSPTGLQRRTSRPLPSRGEVLMAWQPILKDPDLPSSNMSITVEMNDIISQQAETITSKLNVASQGNEMLLDGINMRWAIKNTAFPITRSCLTGTSL